MYAYITEKQTLCIHKYWYCYSSCNSLFQHLPVYLPVMCSCTLCVLVDVEMLRQRSSVLYLEDGSSFTGYGFGAEKDVSGEVGM